MKKRKVAAMGLTIAAAFALTACGSQDTGGEGGGHPVIRTLWR